MCPQERSSFDNCSEDDMKYWCLLDGCYLSTPVRTLELSEHLEVIGENTVASLVQRQASNLLYLYDIWEIAKKIATIAKT